MLDQSMVCENGTNAGYPLLGLNRSMKLIISHEPLLVVLEYLEPGLKTYQKQ